MTEDALDSTSSSPSPAVLEALLNAVSIECTFDPGGGARWSSGTIRVHGALWQGGPIGFQSVDVTSGTAQMTGSEGSTGSSTGETDVRVTATNAGLHFSGITRRGEIVVTSVFAKTDEHARNLAVMSRHGSELDHESAQFYGGCDIR